MPRLLRAFVVIGIGYLVAPGDVLAQSAIAGVVKDATGAVLPGVTVEASSPALIEKVRVGDDQRGGAVPRRRSASGHLHGDLHADRVQHRRPRGDRARSQFRGAGQRRR